MSSRLSIRGVRAIWVLAGLSLIGTLLASSPPQTARALGPQLGCPWPLHLDPNTTNVAFPDQNANYFTLVLPNVGITSLTIKGRFPHARYMSFTTYTGQTQAVDGINDVHIVPSSGHASDNPFVAGNARNTEGAVRDYRITVVNGQRPADPGQVPANTIYTTDANGSHSNKATFIVIYRTYRPDQAFPNDGGGGEPLPTVTANLTGGGTMNVGDPSQCTTSPDQDLGASGLLTNGSLPQLPVGPAGCYPGLNPPAWHKFTNVLSGHVNGTANLCISDNNPQTSLTGPLDQTIPSGGFLENPDNKYMSAVLNVDFFPQPGTANVLVVRSKVPTTPDTFNNAPVMPDCGGACQLRYWSMCTNEGITTRFFACLMDDGLTRLDTSGTYCLVVSRTGDRPRNANSSHNVNWLPFGFFHDDVLIERNMLPDPGFAQAIQNVTPGMEQQTTGAYYPSATYMTAADFERLGCPGFTSTTAFGTLASDLLGPPTQPASTLPNTSAGRLLWGAGIPGLLVAMLLGGLAVAAGPMLRRLWRARRS